MLYSAPLLTLMVVGTFVPVTVMALETYGGRGFTLLSGMKLKAFGTALVPVPLSVTIVGEEDALLVMTTVPFRLASLVGVNTTSMLQVVPLVSATLQLLVCVKSPVVVMLLISAPLVPVTVMVCAALGAPTVCGPNDSVRDWRAA